MANSPQEAFVAALSEMDNAALNKVNPHFKSKYADLPAIRAAVVPALSKHGLAVTQFPDTLDGSPVLRSRVIHKDGTVVSEAVYPLPNLINEPQKMGSAITYARRYSLAAICGISAEEDDDANAATPKTAPKPANTEAKPVAENNASKELMDWATFRANAMKSCPDLEALDDAAEDTVKHANWAKLSDKLRQRLDAVKHEKAAELTPDAAE